MAVMAGLMRMTKFEQRSMCDFVGAKDFDEFTTKNELSRSSSTASRSNQQPPHNHPNTNTPTQTPPSALLDEVAAARAAPGLLILFVIEKFLKIFLKKLEILFERVFEKLKSF